MEHLTLDWTAVTEGIGLVAGLAGAVISLWVRSTVDEKVKAALVEPTKIMAGQHDEIVNLKARCDSQATRDDFHSLALKIERALGQMGEIQQSVNNVKDSQRSTQASIQRVNDFLLNNKVTT